MTPHCRMEKFFDGFEVRYIPHLDNHDIDHLAWIASSRASTPSDVIIEKLTKPSVMLVEEVIDAIKPDLMVIDEPDQGLAYDWMGARLRCSWTISHQDETPN
jgi:hypothetical protein